MKIRINRNSIWCKYFVEQLVKLGVKNVCVSPGSRSTPLTFAFALNRKLKIYSIVDERSCGFFALGISKSTNSPVAIVTTSGTAVAELYPAIIEAYYQRIPLIICTADRPAYLQNRGSNQTINQNNIYKNHIRYFANIGLPQITIKKYRELKNITSSALEVATKNNVGPVHLNFSFDKPFEPKSYTDKVESSFIKKLYSVTGNRMSLKTETPNSIDITQKIKKYSKGLIICGYGKYSKKDVAAIIKLSSSSRYPIIADGTSPLRFGTHNKNNIVNNFSTLIRSTEFLKKYDAEIILQIGGAQTSIQALEFFQKSKAVKILINSNGDKNDPTLTVNKFIKSTIENFCNPIINNVKRNYSVWRKELIGYDRKLENKKKEYFKNLPITFEGKFAEILGNVIPENSNVVISNSLPIRDVDFFTGCSQKKINIFTNRGASGIDGINSTALGIAKGSKTPTILITGDLAFYHDLNGLHNSLKYKIPLTVILINNNGGGIFQSLPISNYKNVFNKYFLTPLNLNFKNFVEAYGGKFYRVKTEKDFVIKLIKSIKNKKLNVLEIITDSKKSKIIRNKYWQTTSKLINSIIDEAKG